MKQFFTLILLFFAMLLNAQPIAVSYTLSETGDVVLEQWDGDGYLWVSSFIPSLNIFYLVQGESGIWAKWKEKRRIRAYNKEEVLVWENGQEPSYEPLEGIDYSPVKNASWGFYPYWLWGGNFYSQADSTSNWFEQEFTTQTYNCRGGAYYNTYFCASHQGENLLPDSIFFGSVYKVDTVTHRDTSQCWEYFYRDQNQLTKIVEGDMTQRSYQPAYNRSILLFDYSASSQLKRIIGLTDTLNYDAFPLGDSLISLVKSGFYLSDEDESERIRAIQYQAEGPEVNFLLEYEYKDSLLTDAWYWSKQWSNFQHDSIVYTSQGKVSALFHLLEPTEASGTAFIYNEKGKLSAYQAFRSYKEENAWRMEYEEEVPLKYMRRKDIPQEKGEEANNSN